MAANPRSRRARIDLPKPVASAHAPWTNTMVGVSAAIVVTAPSLGGLTDAATVRWRRVRPVWRVCASYWGNICVLTEFA
jgi:hypothetical protein